MAAQKEAYDSALSNSRSQFNTEQDDDYRRITQALNGASELGRGYLGVLSPASSTATTAMNFGEGALSRERDKTQDILGVGTMARDLEQKKLDALEAQRLGYSNYDWEQIKKLIDVTSAYPKTGESSSKTPAPASNAEILQKGLGLVSSFF